MAILISFEGCIGSGKTTLAKYFSQELKCKQLLEQHELNPFLKTFYNGDDVKIETEIGFVLIHYSQLKNAFREDKNGLILSDYSIEKDYVFAKMNLKKKEFIVFEQVYNYFINKIDVPDAVIYLDLSYDILKTRISKRGRDYEIVADPYYFEKYNKYLKNYFINFSRSNIFMFNVDDLVLEQRNTKLEEIKNKILEVSKNK